jgi:hypothetical protein
VILAGVLLKMGGYGFLRFSLPMLPDASAFHAAGLPLSSVAVIYTSLVALAQEDMKKLIAYSSGRAYGLRDRRHLQPATSRASKAPCSRCSPHAHRLRRALPLRRRGL